VHRHVPAKPGVQLPVPQTTAGGLEHARVSAAEGAGRMRAAAACGCSAAACKGATACRTCVPLTQRRTPVAAAAPLLFLSSVPYTLTPLNPARLSEYLHAAPRGCAARVVSLLVVVLCCCRVCLCATAALTMPPQR
jgi:hypothetical protein